MLQKAYIHLGCADRNGKAVTGRTIGTTGLMVAAVPCRHLRILPKRPINRNNPYKLPPKRAENGKLCWLIDDVANCRTDGRNRNSCAASKLRLGNLQERPHALRHAVLAELLIERHSTDPQCGGRPAAVVVVLLQGV